MTKRKRLTRKERASVFEKDKGVCYLCNLPVRPGELWDVEHEIAIEAGGADEMSNWRVAHRTKCHPEKTKKDRKVISKVQKMHAAHIGGKPEPVKKIQSRGFDKKERPDRIIKKVVPRTHFFGIPLDQFGDDENE